MLESEMGAAVLAVCNVETPELEEVGPGLGEFVFGIVALPVTSTAGLCPPEGRLIVPAAGRIAGESALPAGEAWPVEATTPGETRRLDEVVDFPTVLELLAAGPDTSRSPAPVATATRGVALWLEIDGFPTIGAVDVDTVAVAAGFAWELIAPDGAVAVGDGTGPRVFCEVSARDCPVGCALGFNVTRLLRPSVARSPPSRGADI
jgi:hypothetical protein